MKFLKNLLSFMIPLIIVLATFALHNAIGNIVDEYKKSINNDYSIMVIANTPIVKENIKTLAKIDVKNIQVLKREDIIINLKEKLSKNSLELLKQKLPYFYKIYLEQYPTTTQLDTIKKELNKISNIKKIETFASDHNKVYSLLILVEQIVQIFLLFIFIFTFLILSKQIKIWLFEHSQRISIIQYHGGSILYAAKPIIKITLLSAIISSAIVIALVISMSNNLSFFLTPEVLSILPNKDYIPVDFIFIIILSFIISTLSTISVLLKHKIK